MALLSFMGKSYYIASSLDNADEVRKLKAVLDEYGWHHTYDWTVHGSVQSAGADRIAEVAEAEAIGVLAADVVITLLPGGRGTHTECGMAIGQVQIAKLVQELIPGTIVERRIVVFSEGGRHFDTTNGTTCAFYFHPYVERFTSMTELLVSLTKES